MMRFLCASLLAMISATAAQAQTTATAPAAVTLAEAYRAAAAADPRVRQLEIEAAQTALRLRAIDAARLPSIRVDARAQYQSDVASFPLRDAGGAPLITPPKGTVDAYVGVEQRLIDPTRAPRVAAARAELDEARARIAVALFALRQEVDEAFFAAESAAARARALEVRMSALAQLKTAADARVREGAALPSEPRAIAATLLQRRQDHQQAALRRRAALDRLATLTAGAVTRDSTLAIPSHETDLPPRLADLRERPEYALFEQTRARLATQAEGIGAESRPRLAAFARAGYGRPGLNFIDDGFNPYWLGGVQLQWSPWDWGVHARERDALALERDIVATEADAFTARLRRSLDADLAEVERLRGAVALDDEIVALRRDIEREAQIRWEARVIALSEYLDRGGELLDAELAREERRVALAAARARVLTAAGVEVK
jgi:outer membrane protein TolC